MIKDINQNKTTPKRKAIEIVFDNVLRAEYWQEQLVSNRDDMTGHEALLVDEQVQKTIERIRKYLRAEQFNPMAQGSSDAPPSYAIKHINNKGVHNDKQRA